MNGNIWQVAIVAVLLGVIFIGADVQFEAAEVEVEIQDEEHTLSTDEPSTLDGADEMNRMYEDEVVTDADTGEELERGDDYEIDYDDAEITAANGDYDGEDVLVDYRYDKPDEETEDLGDIIAPLTVVLTLLLLAVSMGAIISWTGLFGGSGGGR